MRTLPLRALRARPRFAHAFASRFNSRALTSRAPLSPLARAAAAAAAAATFFECAGVGGTCRCSEGRAGLERTYFTEGELAPVARSHFLWRCCQKQSQQSHVVVSEIRTRG